MTGTLVALNKEKLMLESVNNSSAFSGSLVHTQVRRMFVFLSLSIFLSLLVFYFLFFFLLVLVLLLLLLLLFFLFCSDYY